MPAGPSLVPERFDAPLSYGIPTTATSYSDTLWISSQKGLLRKVSWLVYVGPRFVLAKQLMPSLLMLSAGSNPNSTALFAIVGNLVLPNSSNLAAVFMACSSFLSIMIISPCFLL
jgi:hypothetical protein